MKNTPPRFPSTPTPARGPASGGGSAPIRNLRLGRIKAAVWENVGEERTYYSVKFTRTYLDDSKKFQDAENFGRDDLLLLAKLADQVHSFIYERGAAQRPEEQA